MDALTITNVTKTFRDGSREVKAVQDVTLRIPQGSIFGLLGRNGAGKSTLIGMIAGQLKPDTGDLVLFGKSLLTETTEAKRGLGLVPQEVVTEAAFSLYEVLWYTAGLAGMPLRGRKERIAEVLEAVRLTEKKEAKARTLSGGQKRRLMIAKAILHTPRFLILDEPTAGVDIELRTVIWDLVRELNNNGTTILFTTHYLEEAENLCDRLAFIEQGKIVAEGTYEDLQKELDDSGTVYFELLREQEHLAGVTRLASEYQIASVHAAKTLKALVDHYGDNLKSVRSEHANLEKIFLTMTK